MVGWFPQYIPPGIYFTNVYSFGSSLLFVLVMEILKYSPLQQSVQTFSQ